MPVLTCMRGFPASGKSTIALELAKDTNAIRICRDDLRMMLFGVPWTGHTPDEWRVTQAEEALVMRFLSSGFDVVIDATHLNSTYLTKWRKKAGLYDATFVVRDVRTSVEMCVYRDSIRNRQVGEDVIRGMAEQFPMESWPDF